MAHFLNREPVRERTAKPASVWHPSETQEITFPRADLGPKTAPKRYIEGAVPEFPTTGTGTRHTPAVGVAASYETQEREGVALATKENTQ